MPQKRSHVPTSQFGYVRSQSAVIFLKRLFAKVVQFTGLLKGEIDLNPICIYFSRNPSWIERTRNTERRKVQVFFGEETVRFLCALRNIESDCQIQFSYHPHLLVIYAISSNCSLGFIVNPDDLCSAFFKTIACIFYVVCWICGQSWFDFEFKSFHTTKMSTPQQA